MYMQFFKLDHRSMTRACVGSIMALGLLINPELRADDFIIPSALLTLIEQADISAREAGPLINREISEGLTVEADAVLGKIDDEEAILVLERSRTDLKLAESLVQNDVKVRFARKSHEAAVAELKRSQESIEKFPKSVSQTELDRLQLLVDKAKLEIEQANVDLAQAALSQSLKQNDVARATLQLERRRIKAPFPGMVVQWKKQRGEWVEPGTPVVRMIRLNRLRAEAFVSAKQLSPDLVGKSATVFVEVPEKPKLTFEGRLTFVDPEIDPVNLQVRVWVEVNNSNLQLRPGQTVSVRIHDANR